MRHSFRNLVLVSGLLLAGAVQQVGAFSLLGPLAAWQTQEIGYDPGDLGGPMNLGEEYRYNLPLLTYGFDESFLNYFGAKGVEEVEKAFKILNDLPAVSDLSADLSEYPLDTRRFNHRAGALYLFDVKTYVLSTVLTELGLGCPERYAWTLRARAVVNNVPYYTVIMRNFDPLTFEPTAYVNGSLYTYQIFAVTGDPFWDSVELAVDPSLPDYSAVAGMNEFGYLGETYGVSANQSAGMFVTGLTRDDVGGLRYLYRPENVNVEVLTNAVLAPLGSSGLGGGLIGAETSGGSPWGAPSGTINTSTNTTTTTSTNAPVDPALRPGLDRLTFVRVNFDSLVGNWKVLTNRFTDTYITNYSVRSQLLQRTLPYPDFLITAEDLGVDGFAQPFITSASVPGYINNDALNGLATLDGPGTIAPGVRIGLTKLGPFLYHIFEGGEVDGNKFFLWGSYDGTTNPPVVYPSGTSIKALEALIMSGAVRDGGSGTEGSPWQAP